MPRRYAKKPSAGHYERDFTAGEVNAMESLVRAELKGRRFTANPARAATVTDPDTNTPRPMTQQERSRWT